MKYVCEICNEKFDTSAKAEECELKHKREKVKEEMQAATEAKISEIVNAYITRYKTVPNISITEENQRIILDAMFDRVGQTLDALFGSCRGDEVSCDNCDCSNCDDRELPLE